MRPVNKGKSPYLSIKNYEDALPYLEKRLGTYCSYCELPLKHVPEVEHITSKSNGGDWTAWENLLMGCKYCNTRKGKKTSPENVKEYIWPDCDNTALAYTYEHGVPKVNQKELLEIDPAGRFYKRAQNLFELVDLGHVPSKKEKDRRFAMRIEAYQIAKDALDDWKTVKNSTDDVIIINKFIKLIVRTALECGFFSVWMTVFSEENEIQKALVEEFPNTRKECFDKSGRYIMEII